MTFLVITGVLKYFKQNANIKYFMINYFKVKHCLKTFPGLETTVLKWSDISWFPVAWELSAFTTLYMPNVKTEYMQVQKHTKDLSRKECVKPKESVTAARKRVRLKLLRPVYSLNHLQRCIHSLSFV